MTTVETAQGIDLFRLCAIRGALKLEKLGMKHSRLGKIRKPVAIQMGLKPNADYDTVIKAVQDRIDQLKAA